MTGKMRIFIMLLLIISMAVIDTDSTSACSCVYPGPPDEELAQAAAVFAGKVVGISKPIGFGSISSADPIKVTFRVYEVWKGSVSLTTTITTSRSSASCGYPFENGEEYIVYAYGSEGDLSVSLCSRTRPLDDAAEDLEVLELGTAPLADGIQITEILSDFQGPILIGAGIILLLLVVAAIIKRSSRT
jgi:hypothetical protein